MLSIRLATFTVLPQISYCGLRAPITPATTGPTLIPVKKTTRECRFRVSPLAALRGVRGVLQLTDSQDEVVVGLVVDLVQDIEHFDSEVCDGAQVG